MTVKEARQRGLLKQVLNQQSKRSKYGNQRTFYEGRWYSSKKEAKRAGELDLLKRAGVVLDWIPQFKLEIKHNGVKICSYFADFKVFYQNGRVEYEDTKGVETAVFKLKKKMVKAFHGIDIKII